MTRRLKWGVPETPPPKHPYRDTILVYAAFAIVIVLVAWLTGGGIKKAVAVAIFFFAVATAWTSYRFHAKLREQHAESDR